MSVVGFDVGNKRCIVAVPRHVGIDDGIDFALNDDSKRETPAIVYFGKKQRFIGTAGDSLSLMNPENAVSQIKRLIGKQFRDPEVQRDLQSLPFTVDEGPDGGVRIHARYLGENRVFNATQILAMLLSNLKQIAKTNLKTEVVDCCIGIPFYFTDLQRRAFLDAASIAGLDCIRLMHETTATALAYGIYNTSLPENDLSNVVFVDIGHASMQVCVAAFKKGQLKILTHTCDRSLGGRDFDEVLFRYFADKFKEQYQIDVPTNVRASQRLRATCEKLKKRLSAKHMASYNLKCLMDEKDVRVSIKRNEFEQLAQPMLERVKGPCVQALEKAGITVDKIHAVNVVGSGSHVPAILKILTETFGKKPGRIKNTSVAEGCALQCAILSPTFKVREFKVQESFPFSIAFGRKGSAPEAQWKTRTLFPRGNTLPDTKVINFLRSGTFTVDILYADVNEVRAPALISSHTIGPFQTSKGEKAKLKVRVQLDKHGIVRIDSATMIEEEETIVLGPFQISKGEKAKLKAKTVKKVVKGTKAKTVNKKVKETSLQFSDTVFGVMPQTDLQKATDEEDEMALQDMPNKGKAMLDELKNEDIQLPLNSIRRLSTIARALGKKKTRKELIPSLSENNDDNNEVLLAMAEELGVFIPYVGGVDYAHVLLPPLETLCTVEKTCVRDKAVESLCRIGSKMKINDLVDWFIPLVKRLAVGELFRARVSACGLFHIAYPSAPELLKAELRSIYGKLCKDDMWMVRISAATNLEKYAATVESQYLKTDIMSFFEDLTHDGQDSVRLLAFEGCVALGKLLETQDYAAHILPFIIAFSKDESRQVRSMVANQLYELCEAVGPGPTRGYLERAYGQLLCDNKAEVRIAAVRNLTKFCRILNFRSAIEHIRRCVKDESQQVRSMVANHLYELYVAVGQERTRGDLEWAYGHLLRDNEAEIRIAAARKLTKFCSILNRQSAIERILRCVEDESWRVRSIVANQLYELYEAVGSDRARANLVGAYVQLLRDTEAEVRIAAVRKLTKFCSISAIERILRCVEELSTDSSQKVRFALSSVIMDMARVLGKEATIDQLLPIFLALLEDEFPNVPLHIISKLDQVNQVIGIDLLSQSLLPAIVKFAGNKRWRVRLEITKYIPLLASQLGVEFFDDKLRSLCMHWLDDQVFSIREAAAKNLKILAEKFGPEWAIKHIVPQVVGKINNSNYSCRMTILMAMSLLAPVMGREITCQTMLPVVINASKDRVANVRRKVAEVLQSLIAIVDHSVVEQSIRPCLVGLSEDSDVDVRFFAGQALQACDQVMMSS